MYFTLDQSLDEKQKQSLGWGWKHQVYLSPTKCSRQGTGQVPTCLMSAWSHDLVLLAAHSPRMLSKMVVTMPSWDVQIDGFQPFRIKLSWSPGLLLLQCTL